MVQQGYRAMARVFGVVFPIVGAAAIVGGKFAEHFVAGQLRSEEITMPGAEDIEREVGIGLVSEQDATRLRPHAGVTLSSGDQARIYADHYVLSHMIFAAEKAGVPRDKATYAGVGDFAQELTLELRDEVRRDNPELGPGEVNALARAEINDPESDYSLARRIKSLHELRAENFFMGNSIRGMLLNAYGWWLLGQIAKWAGCGLIGLGAALFGGSWLGRRD